MTNLHTKKTCNGSNFGWLIRQMSINQKSGRQTFCRRFVSGFIFVSPYPPECYLQNERKTEPDVRLDQDEQQILTERAFLVHSSLRSKRFQSRYCAKVRAGAKKKKVEGGGGGEKRKRLPANPTILENAP